MDLKLGQASDSVYNNFEKDSWHEIFVNNKIIELSSQLKEDVRWIYSDQKLRKLIRLLL